MFVWHTLLSTLCSHVEAAVGSIMTAVFAVQRSRPNQIGVKRGKKQELSLLGLSWFFTLPRDLRGDYDVPLEVANIVT